MPWKPSSSPNAEIRTFQGGALLSLAEPPVANSTIDPLLRSRGSMRQSVHAASRSMAGFAKATISTAPPAPPPRCAVIGGGVAGLSAAHSLVQHDVAATVFDMGVRGAGGRVASRQFEALSFDTGAQFFTARSPDFRKQLEEWQASGVVQEWRGRHGRICTEGAPCRCSPSSAEIGRPGPHLQLQASLLAHGYPQCIHQSHCLPAARADGTFELLSTSSSGGSGSRGGGGGGSSGFCGSLTGLPLYVGTPTNNALCQQMARQLQEQLGAAEVQSGCIVQSVTRTSGGCGGAGMQWQLRGSRQGRAAAGEPPQPADQQDLGSFDAVILADAMPLIPGALPGGPRQRAGRRCRLPAAPAVAGPAPAPCLLPDLVPSPDRRRLAALQAAPATSAASTSCPPRLPSWQGARRRRPRRPASRSWRPFTSRCRASPLTLPPWIPPPPPPPAGAAQQLSSGWPATAASQGGRLPTAAVARRSAGWR